MLFDEDDILALISGIIFVFVCAILVLMLHNDQDNKDKQLTAAADYLLSAGSYEIATVLSKDNKVQASRHTLPRAVVAIGNDVKTIDSLKSIFPSLQEGATVYVGTIDDELYVIGIAQGNAAE